MNSRNNTNFNEINTNNVVLNDNNINQYDGSGNNLFKLIGQGINNICIEQDCCDKGTVWNSDKGLCTIETFTNILDSNDNNNIIQPNSTNELQNYSFI